jgi:hypothetical protein
MWNVILWQECERWFCDRSVKDDFVTGVWKMILRQEYERWFCDRSVKDDFVTGVWKMILWPECERWFCDMNVKDDFATGVWKMILRQISVWMPVTIKIGKFCFHCEHTALIKKNKQEMIICHCKASCLLRLIFWSASTITKQNDIGCVIVGVLASNVIVRWTKPRSGQTKDYKIGVCCFTTKHSVLRSKNKDW